MDQPAEIPFRKLIESLLDIETTFDPRYLYRLSDMDDDDLEILKDAWDQVPTWRRRALLEDIEELNSRDYLLSFSALATFALQDRDAIVRQLAVRTLWEYEEPALIPKLIDLLKHDEDDQVRASTAGALGPYVFLGEIDKLSVERCKEIEDVLLDVIASDQPALVRRNALESLGYSSREEVPALIEKAYRSQDEKWLASALFAMGRSANEKWIPLVIRELTNERPQVRTEAARAAGELEIRDAVDQLLEMIYDDDESTRHASIWSLSQIGGEGVEEAFEALYDEIDDDEEIEFLESAVENLSFTDSLNVLPFFDLADFDDNDLTDDQDDDLDLE
jgi:HEAT repeat protein